MSRSSSPLWNNKYFVLAAVKRNCRALQSASEELQADQKFILQAVKQNGSALQYASEELQADRKFILQAVKQDGSLLQYVSEALKADREIVLAAVKQDGSLLQYASEALKADREIVLTAVKQDDRALRDAAEELQADREIFLAAVKQNVKALKYASKQLKSDEEIGLAALKNDAGTIYDIDASLLHKAEFIAEVIAHYHQLYLAEQAAKRNIFTPIAKFKPRSQFSDIAIYTADVSATQRKRPLAECLSSEEASDNLPQAKRAKLSTADNATISGNSYALFQAQALDSQQHADEGSNRNDLGTGLF